MNFRSASFTAGRWQVLVRFGCSGGLRPPKTADSTLMLVRGRGVTAAKRRYKAEVRNRTSTHWQSGIFIFAATIGLYLASAVPTVAQQVKVMQWNTHRELGLAASNSTPQAAAIARIVNYNQPDVLLINEVIKDTVANNQAALTAWVTNNLPYLGRQPGVTFFVAVSTVDDFFIRNAAISRYPILAATTYDDGMRGLHAFRVQLSGTNQLQVYHAHLKCCDDDCPEKQAQAQFDSDKIKSVAATNSTPYIFAGDWNEDEQHLPPVCTLTSTYHPISTIRTNGGLVEFRPTMLNSSTFGTWDSTGPTLRFDYILAATNRLSPTSGVVFDTVNQASNGLYTNASPQNLVGDSGTASDHLCVFANYFFPTSVTNFSVTPTNVFASSGNQAGPFSPSSQVYTLTNSDTIPLFWSITKTSSWLTVSILATNSTLGAGAATNITATINSSANSLFAGTYVDTINFSNTATGVLFSRDVTLTVNATPPSASFTGSPTNGFDSLAVTFTDTSTGSITNRFWNFGDNSTTNVTTNSVTHTYAPGTYTVTLIASGPVGVSTNTKPNYITVLIPPSTVDVEAANLQDGLGNLAPTSSVVALVADTGANGFVDPQSTYSLSLGATWGADDKVVGLWDLRDSVSCTGSNGGALCGQMVEGYTNGIAPGQKLQLYWFPSLTVGSNTLGVTDYGRYTDTNSPALDGSDDWQIPAGGSAVTLRFYTALLAGSNPETAGLATNLTVGLTAFQSWQIQYFGDPNNAAAASSADPDGDGLNNLAEFLAGTDPTNNAAVFRIISVTAEGSNVRLTWTMGSNRTNALQLSTSGISGNYSNNFADIFTVTNTVGSVTSYLDVGAATNAPVRYYRVRLVP